MSEPEVAEPLVSSSEESVASLPPVPAKKKPKKRRSEVGESQFEFERNVEGAAAALPGRTNRSGKRY